MRDYLVPSGREEVGRWKAIAQHNVNDCINNPLRSLKWRCKF
jgi:hypothetical protein